MTSQLKKVNGWISSKLSLWLSPLYFISVLFSSFRNWTKTIAHYFFLFAQHIDLEPYIFKSWPAFQHLKIFQSGGSHDCCCWASRPFCSLIDTCADRQLCNSNSYVNRQTAVQQHNSNSYVYRQTALQQQQLREQTDSCATTQQQQLRVQTDSFATTQRQQLCPLYLNIDQILA